MITKEPLESLSCWPPETYCVGHLHYQLGQPTSREHYQLGQPTSIEHYQLSNQPVESITS